MLTLTWGVLTATGWVRTVTGRKALRGTHMVLATGTLIFGGVHALGFFYLTIAPYSLDYLFVPFVAGQEIRHIAGIIGFCVCVSLISKRRAQGAYDGFSVGASVQDAMSRAPVAPPPVPDDMNPGPTDIG